MFVALPLPKNDTAAVDLRRADERLGLLRRLSQLGMDLAQALRDRVVEADGPPPAVSSADPVLSFTRVARAVRQSLALEVRLEDELRSLTERTEAAVAAARAEALSRAAEENHKQVGARKQAVWTILRPEIEAATSQGDDEGQDDADDDGDLEDDDSEDDDFYALTSDLHERLADAAEQEDFLMRPVEAIIEEIRQALGLGGLDDPPDTAPFPPAAQSRSTDRVRGRPSHAPMKNRLITCADVAEAWRKVGETEPRAESG